MVPPEIKMVGLGCHFNLYRLDNVGDEIPMHSHEVDHVGLVIQGKVLAYTDKTQVEVGPDHMITLHKGHPHGFIAKEPNTILLNVFNTKHE